MDLYNYSRYQQFIPQLSVEAPQNNSASIHGQSKCCQRSEMDPGNEGDCNQVQQTWAKGRITSGTCKGPYPESCPNISTLQRCPDGVKVNRTFPIKPVTRPKEYFFKIPNASVYKTDFAPKKAEVNKSFAPERFDDVTEGEFEKESLTKYDYHPMPVCPYKKPPWAFAKLSEKSIMNIDGNSLYKTDFIPKKGRRAVSAKPEGFFHPDQGPMDVKSVYESDFVEVPLVKDNSSLSKKQMLNEIRNSCRPFDGLTTYNQDYVPKEIKPAKLDLDEAKRVVRILDPIDCTTTYKANFGPFYFDDNEGTLPGQHGSYWEMKCDHGKEMRDKTLRLRDDVNHSYP